MSTHKHIDKICVVAVILCLILSVVLMNGAAVGIEAAQRVVGYEAKLFDTSRVHAIDIVTDDWDSFIDTCENEEYTAAAIVIDGEAYKNAAIRAKGNTSLTTVSSMDSDRYSFKIEFDHYDSTKSYYGLDKLSLNNLIQDSTFMKDYLTYRLMGSFDVCAPLCSYVYITVNGEDWGLYLAVEGIEDAFLQRNYGGHVGELYKPDSMDIGGGRGNGMGFDMDSFLESSEGDASGSDRGQNQSGNFGRPGMPDGSDDFDPSSGFGGGRGSSDVKLQYIDDDPDSYSNIFENAKTDITNSDKKRLIESLRKLSAGEDIESAVDVEQVIRYFVVHNFVVNGDSYTGSMVHNYYLYEKDGRLSMIPWDYNLAFGTFQGNNASSAVNDPIDTPLSSNGSGDRPMIDWILSSDEYTELYHSYFSEFIESTDFASLIDETSALIAPYVEKDPTAFYSYDEFEVGVTALKQFCALRAESVCGQLDGTIPSTSDGQNGNGSALVDTSGLNLSDMGSMMGGKGGIGGERPLGDASDNVPGEGGDGNVPDAPPDGAPGNMPENMAPNDNSGGSDNTPPEMGGDPFGGQNPMGGGGFPGEMPPDGSDFIGGTPPTDGTAPNGQNGEGAPGGGSFPGMAGGMGEDGNSGGFPGGMGGAQGGQMPSSPIGSGARTSQSGTNTVILLAISILILLCGLGVAFKYKR